MTDQTPRHALERVDYQLSELSTFYRNPRLGDVDRIAESLATNGQYRPIVVNLGRKTGRPLEILAGNHTFKAAQSLGWETITATTVDVDDNEAARIVAADNRTADLGGYDWQELAELLAPLPDLDGTGYTESELADLLDDVDETPDADTTGEDNYTKAVDVPYYEPKGPQPPVAELYDDTKTKNLEKSINAAELPDEVTEFLTAAAQRHTVLRFDKIAEYYAHASPEVQELMEESALVIIDFEKALKNGYVKLTDRLADLRATVAGGSHD